MQWKNRFSRTYFPGDTNHTEAEFEMEQQIVNVTFTRFSGNWRRMTEGLRTEKR